MRVLLSEHPQWAHLPTDRNGIRVLGSGTHMQEHHVRRVPTETEDLLNVRLRGLLPVRGIEEDPRSESFGGRGEGVVNRCSRERSICSSVYSMSTGLWRAKEFA